MSFLTPVKTEYGTAFVIARMDGGYLVSLPKDKMDVRHPNYRGGPCVNFFWRGQ